MAFKIKRSIPLLFEGTIDPGKKLETPKNTKTTGSIGRGNGKRTGNVDSFLNDANNDGNMITRAVSKLQQKRAENIKAYQDKKNPKVSVSNTIKSIEGSGTSGGSSTKGTSSDTRTYNPFVKTPPTSTDNTKILPPKKDLVKKNNTTAKRTTYNNKNLGGQDQLIKKDKKKQEFVPSPKKSPPPKDKVKVTPKDKIKAGRALKKEGRKEKRSERKDARLERRIASATKKGKAALASGKVGKGSKSLEMRRKVDRLKAKKTSKGETAKTKAKTKVNFRELATSLDKPIKKVKTKEKVKTKSNTGGSALKKVGNLEDPKNPKPRTHAQILKAYPGAKKVEGKINTYKYKGATLNPALFPVEKKAKTVKQAIDIKEKK